MVESVVDTYGRIDVLVNAAGILIRTMSRLADVSNMEWDLTLNTNLRGVFVVLLLQVCHTPHASVRWLYRQCLFRSRGKRGSL